jgi:hypothetical protein
VLDRTYARYVPRRPRFPYFDLLDRIHQHLRPRTYVEIGVSTGRSLTLALPGTRCIGVDPEPQIIFSLPRRARIFHQTSDAFFADHDLRTLLGGLPVDLAFIDGMHHFEYALRDFINLERFAGDRTTVLVHDCLPVDEVTAARERTTDFWSGDVWRLILLLRRWRPDLEVAVVDWGPSGVGVISGLDPGSSVLSDHYDEIVAEYLALPYSALDDGSTGGSKAEQLQVVPGTWPAVAPLLPPRPFRHTSLTLLKAVRALDAYRFAHRQSGPRSTAGGGAT